MNPKPTSEDEPTLTLHQLQGRLDLSCMQGIEWFRVRGLGFGV